MLLFILTIICWSLFLGLVAYLSIRSNGRLLTAGPVQQISISVWQQFGRWSEHPRLCMLAVFLATIILRVVALPVLPIPHGRSHDEFSFLLAGQTFALGRITNPTPPFWQFFETEHELLQPTYMSKYPPMQGIFIALGFVLGNPWFGILFSYALMCACVYWTALAYLPRRWALMAGLLSLVHPGIASYWCNSYFGGAAAAIGGALVLGGCGRLQKKVTVLSLWLVAIGLLIEANSRPFEGAALSVVPISMLLYSSLKKQQPKFNDLLKYSPAAILIILSGLGAMLYYNYRITGNALLMPYTEWQRQYSPIPLSLFSKLGPIPHYYSSILRDNYVTCDYGVYSKFLTFPGWLNSVINERFIGIQQYFVGITLTPIACASLLALKDRKMLVLWWSVLVVFVALSSTALGFQRHYPAPMTAAIEVLMVQGFRHLRLLRFKNVHIGIPLARVFVASCVIGLLCGFASLPGAAGRMQYAQDEFPRVALMEKLSKIPGKHLIVVHYAIGHDPRREYVINEPDIENSKIIWARDFGDEKNKELLDHFKDRQAWLFDPDSDGGPRLYTWAEGRNAKLSTKVDDYNWTH